MYVRLVFVDLTNLAQLARTPRGRRWGCGFRKQSEREASGPQKSIYSFSLQVHKKDLGQKAMTYQTPKKTSFLGFLSSTFFPNVPVFYSTDTTPAGPWAAMGRRWGSALLAAFGVAGPKAVPKRVFLLKDGKHVFFFQKNFLKRHLLLGDVK